MPLQAVPKEVVIAAIGFSALASAFVLGILARRKLRLEIDRLNSELARSEIETREQKRQASRMRNEQRTMANFVRLLPGSVQELNRDRLDPRAIPGLVIKLAAAIFEPEQIALYRMRPPDSERRAPRRLHLVARTGLPDVPESLEAIHFGEGKIGWVAEHQMDMSVEDWSNPSRTEGSPPTDNHPALKLDLVSPLLHHGEKRTETLGVLCLGNPTVRPRDEKLMLQMVTNLGSIALIHARNVRQLKSQADHDGLTSLMNKRHFMETLGILINNAESEMRPFGVFIFDIDFFKRYNDSNGHLAGDELLKTIAQVIRDNLRPGDLACRYGGEEFVIVMPDTDGRAAEQIAERLRAAIEKFDFVHGTSQPLGHLTISGGVAAFPADGTNGTDLISHADQALYRAKAAGRNRVVRHRSVSIGIPDNEDFEDAPILDPAHGQDIAWDR